MIVDTSALLAYFDANESAHSAVAEVIDGAQEALVVSPYVIAELDYLVLTRHGARAEQAMLSELAGGAWTLAEMDASRLEAARRIVVQYADIPIGVADASNVVLAAIYATRTIVTLDRRHFGVLRLADGAAPRILPDGSRATRCAHGGSAPLRSDDHRRQPSCLGWPRHEARHPPHEGVSTE